MQVQVCWCYHILYVQYIANVAALWHLGYIPCSCSMHYNNYYVFQLIRNHFYMTLPYMQCLKRKTPVCSLISSQNMWKKCMLRGIKALKRSLRLLNHKVVYVRVHIKNVQPLLPLSCMEHCTHISCIPQFSSPAMIAESCWWSKWKIWHCLS